MKIAILGVGLIGGSIGLAAHRAAARDEAGGSRGGGSVHVSGFDPEPAALEAALALGAIDEACSGIAEAAEDAEIVFAAGPVSTLAASARAALLAARGSCLVTDVGSTKRGVMAQLKEFAASGAFIGGHPLAGAELSGVKHARADLFDGALWCLTPRSGSEAGGGASPRSDGPQVGGGGSEAGGGEQRRARLIATIEMLGARPLELRAEEHDRLMAEVSHLPHILASLLMHELERSEIAERLAASGPSFMDGTRVAGSASGLWADIYAANADMLCAAVDRAISGLEEVKGMLARCEADRLYAWHEAARRRREALRGGAQL